MNFCEAYMPTLKKGVVPVEWAGKSFQHFPFYHWLDAAITILKNNSQSFVHLF